LVTSIDTWLQRYGNPMDRIQWAQMKLMSELEKAPQLSQKNLNPVL